MTTATLTAAAARHRPAAAAAGARGATEPEIHDTVPTPAVFRTCNRCADGPGTGAPGGVETYDRAGAFRAAHGCRAPAPAFR